MGKDHLRIVRPDEGDEGSVEGMAFDYTDDDGRIIREVSVGGTGEIVSREEFRRRYPDGKIVKTYTNIDPRKV